MINIFYNIDSYGGMTRGPTKVVKNLLQSLDDCNIPYSINNELYEYNLFLGWGDTTIPKYKKLKNKQNIIIGPQFWPWGTDIFQIEEYKKVISPSKTTEKILNKFFPQLKTGFWPVGIYAPDIKKISPTKDCLVYYKNRPVEHLQLVLDFLEKRNITYTGLEYGNYTQEEFKESLSEVKYCVIVDNTESQGIAIQEMMSVNKPLFVWNQIDGVRTDYRGNTYKVEASTIPYWSNECGEYVNEFENFEDKFDKFLNNINNYSPQKFVERELSPKKSIEILLDLFEND